MRYWPVAWLAVGTAVLGVLSVGFAERYFIALLWLAGVIGIRYWRTRPGVVFMGLYVAAIVWTFAIPIWGDRV